MGFSMPAEWELHEATWIAWPHNRSDWPGRFAPIPWVYGEIVRKLARVERVRILVEDLDREHDARRILRKAGADLEAVEFYVCRTNRGWVRDCGPIFLKDAHEDVAVANFRFNAWAKYDDWRRDNAVPAFIARRLDMRRWDFDFVLEGGSIDVNGCGRLLTTEECLLSPVQARNPGLSRAEIERALCEYLGVREILWLGRGIAGDDTHGHIDDLARFVDPETVAAVSELDSADPNYEPLRENLSRLKAYGLRVVELPSPEPLFFDGRRLPASYANFYIANKLVLVPTFNDPNDRRALQVLAKLFPDREVTGIHCVDLIWGLGTLHCMTQQQPAGPH